MTVTVAFPIERPVTTPSFTEATDSSEETQTTLLSAVKGAICTLRTKVSPTCREMASRFKTIERTSGAAKAGRERQPTSKTTAARSTASDFLMVMIPSANHCRYAFEKRPVYSSGWEQYSELCALCQNVPLYLVLEERKLFGYNYILKHWGGFPRRKRTRTARVSACPFGKN